VRGRLPLAVACAIAAQPARAEAHSVGLSFGQYRLSGHRLDAELTFSRRELLEAVPGLDRDHDGQVADAELESDVGGLESALVAPIQVTTQSSTGARIRCPGKLDSVAATEQDGAILMAHFDCPAPSELVSVTLGFIEALPPGHRHWVHASGGGSPIELVAYRRQPSFDLARGSGEATGFLGFVRMGVEHILTGYDHLMFLLGLILVGGRLRSLIGVITAFTLAHSITLGAAALGALSPSPRVIEPLIALSVAYVGVENWFVKDASRRWRLTFPFGLIHGFGFAGALRELAISREQVPMALLGFNLGVEAGQLSVLGVFLPLLFLAEKSQLFVRHGVRAISTVIAVVGLCWFVLRLSG
jgi:hypothetical protein